MRRARRLAIYLGILISVWAAIGILASIVIAKSPVQYTTRWVIILPGSGAGLAVSLESIGQASSQSSSPYTNTSVDPKVNYQAIATSDPVIIDAARRSNMSTEAFSSLKIKLVDQTALIDFSISGDTAEQALAKAEAHFAAFRATLEHLRRDEFATRENASRLSIETYERTLDTSQQELLDFQKNSRLISMDQFQSMTLAIETLKEKIEQTTAELKATRIQRQTLMARLGIDGDAASQAMLLQRDASFQSLLTERTKAQAVLTEQAGKWGDRHPEVMTSQAGVDALTQALFSRARILLSPTLSMGDFRAIVSAGNRGTQEAMIQRIVELEIKIKGLASQRESFIEAHARREEKINGSMADAAQLQALMRQQQVAAAVYTTALAKIDIGKIDPFTSYPMLQLLSAPVAPDSPDKLGKKLAMLGAIGSSFFATIGLVLLWIRKPYIRKLRKSE
ncbi:GumC family protein [Larsenimonas rhizosphaerae]|uniref:Tyrosine kinase G-rich domain-containing protein n=1 Tax=Larsenimonas rhizosphaerae TaxID=2944682 RepID=A0AA41ZF14_9GAMM|nr:hypothetical protein [Larsenimonas rhizosphaerae]MCX2523617.1 hypothetical protein [Larsenimonas rhizosphaerae]